MTRWVKKLLGRLRRVEEPPEAVPEVGEETGRLLAQGAQSLQEARSGVGGKIKRTRALRESCQAYRTALKRRPGHKKAMEGHATALFEMAVRASEKGQDPSAEWTQAIVRLGRLLAADPKHVAARTTRAALYLVAAVRLRAKGESGRASLEQAAGDLATAASLHGGKGGAQALERILERVQDHEHGKKVALPTIPEIRAAWATAPAGPPH